MIEGKGRRNWSMPHLVQIGGLKMLEFNCCVNDLDEKCAECKYADQSAFSKPCVECGFNYSRFEQKEDKFCNKAGKAVKWND